jgi:SAM-dependent methyltransferase
MSHTYVHGTAPTEQERLALLNRLTNDTFIRFLGVRPGMRVLEVGSGLGILANAVAEIASEVVGVEQSGEQIAAARAAGNVTFVQGDAHRLELEDDSFDLVYARYVLEHVGDPEQVVREMRRVARPGARVAACENDISLMRLDPPSPAFERGWQALADYQRSLGGDALIGRRLFRLFRNAGLHDVEISVQPEVHWAGSPGFEAWVRNVIGNIESARRGMDATIADEAVAELEAFLTRDDASVVFVWNRAIGVK